MGGACSPLPFLSGGRRCRGAADCQVVPGWAALRRGGGFGTVHRGVRACARAALPLARRTPTRPRRTPTRPPHSPQALLRGSQTAPHAPSDPPRAGASSRISPRAATRRWRAMRPVTRSLSISMGLSPPTTSSSRTSCRTSCDCHPHRSPHTAPCRSTRHCRGATNCSAPQPRPTKSQAW